MLPFSKRKRSDEIELEDADIVVLEEAAVEIDVADIEIAETAEADAIAPAPVDERPQPQLPRISPPPKSPLRRLLTSAASGSPRDRFEDDVADECLKSIAAATSRTCLSDSFPASIVPPAPRLPYFESSIDELLAEVPLPQFEISDTDETTRRPALSSSSMPAIPFSRDSVPGVLPIPAAAPSASSIPTPIFSRTTSSPQLPAASSIAPVAMSSTPRSVDRTVLLVRQPPKAAWVAAAAFLGAACALLGMHLLTRSPDASPAAMQATVTAPPPPTQATPAAPLPPPATVRFDDDQGVAVIAAPPATVSAAPPAPAPKPVVTTASVQTPKPAAKAASLGPKLPDGSMALTKSPSAPAAHAPAQPAPQAEPAPAPASGANAKKRLTPEQELAEAQLKASMK